MIFTSYCTSYESSCAIRATPRRTQWLAQQRRRQAVEKLIEKKDQSLQIIDNRIEQQMMDELATQRLLRRSIS